MSAVDTGWRRRLARAGAALGGRVTAVTAATAGIVAASALPWYGIEWSAGDSSGSWTEACYANVWEFSTVWSAAIILGVAAGVCWLWLRGPEGAWPVDRVGAAGGWVDRRVAAVAGVAIALVVLPLWLTLPATGLGADTTTTGQFEIVIVEGSALGASRSEVGVIQHDVPFVTTPTATTPTCGTGTTRACWRCSA